MLQRIQTLFQALAVVCLALYLFMPIWSKTAADKSKTLVLDAWKQTEYGPTVNAKVQEVLKTSTDTWYIGASAALGIVVMVFSISQYNKRILQMQLGIAFSLCVLATSISSFLAIRFAEATLDPTLLGMNELGLYLPFAALFLNMAANRFIRKDEQLVRSMDRLR